MITRTNIINHLIQKYNYKTYLEIGLFDSNNYSQIIAPIKYGVDPSPKALCKNAITFLGTSDDFFKKEYNIKFDIIFIDGLHLDSQVRKDISNSLLNLNQNGTIVMHDCLPTNETEQKEDPEIANYGPWLGTCWKAFAYNRMTREDLTMFTLNTDCGCGIIRFGKQKLFPYSEESNLTYDFYLKNAAELMQIKGIEEFQSVL